MILYVRIVSPFIWVRVNESAADKIDSFGEAERLKDITVDASCRVVGIVPGEFVTVHELEIPATTRKQFALIVPNILQEKLTQEKTRVHYVINTWRKGEKSMVLVTDQEMMAQWTQLISESGLEINTLIPEYALLPLHNLCDTTLVASNDRLLGRSQNGFGLAISSEFQSAVIAGLSRDTILAVNNQKLAEQLSLEYPDMNIKIWECGNQIRHWLERNNENHLSSPFNLMVGQWKPVSKLPKIEQFRLAGGLLIIAFIFLLFTTKLQINALHKQGGLLEEQMQQLIKERDPTQNATPAGSELIIFQRLLSNIENKSDNTQLVNLLIASAPILKQHNANVTNLNFRDGKLIVNCELSDFSTVDQLQQALNSSTHIQSNLQFSGSNNGKISARYLVSQNRL